MNGTRRVSAAGLSPLRALIWGLAVVLAGAYLAFELEFEWIPELTTSFIEVRASWANASARATESRVTAKLEEEMLQSLWVKKVMSRTSPGSAVIRVACREGVSVSLCTSDIITRIGVLRRSLPKGAELKATSAGPELFRESASELMTLQLTAPIPETIVRDIGERNVAPQLLKLDGVAEVRIEGGDKRELHGAVQAELLEVYRSSATVLQRTLERAVRSESYGAFSTGGRQILLHRAGRHQLRELVGLSLETDFGGGNTMLDFHDLGRLALATAPANVRSRVDGQPVVFLSIVRTPGSHILHVAQKVREAIRDIEKGLPPGARLLIAEDLADHVRKQSADLVVRGAVGVLLVALVLIVFLNGARAVSVALFGVLVSLSAGVMLFQPLGLSLNILTIAGLVLLFGLLVDNSVVVIERLQAELSTRRGDGCSTYAAARCATLSATWRPLLGGTLSTCVVFLPMLYLSGDLRDLFTSFSVLAALTLGFSLAVSILLIPCLFKSLQTKVEQDTVPANRVRRWAMMFFCGFARYPRMTLVAIVLVIGLPTSLLPDQLEAPPEGWQSEDHRRFSDRYNQTIGKEFIRKIRLWLDPLVGGVTRTFVKKVQLGRRWDLKERPKVTVWIKLPAGSGIDRTDERLRPFEREAVQSPSVRRTLVNIHRRVAQMTVLFHDDAMSGDEPYLVRERLISHALQVSGMEVSVSGLLPVGFYSGLGRVSGYVVHAYGPSYERLEGVSKEFAHRLSQYPRIANVDINAGYRQPPAREVIRVHWGVDASARTGFSARELTAVLQPQLWRETPDFYADLEGDPRMPVRIVMEGAEDLDLDTLLNRPLAASVGGPIRLADHVELSIAKDPPIIERIDQQYRRTLRVYYRGPYRMGREVLDKEIARMKMPPGYRLERPKHEFFTTDVQIRFLWLLLGTIGLIYLVISAVLESWYLSAVVMLSVPLAWVGVALGFLVTGQNFAEGAFLGCVLTIGIAVNDSILLADAYRRLRQRRPTAPVPRLALLAVRQRLRPMWTTTLTSIAGMLPLLIIPDAGNFWIGLAVTVVGGLLASTLLAPAATVALLSWGWRRRQKHQSATAAQRDLAWEAS